MGTAAGVLNQQSAAQAMAGRAAPMDTPSGSNAASATGGNSATISANDFLTLLVTEMRNQDPTTATDPNQYINQLVQVNSLEQLIGINQTLTAAFGAPVTEAPSSSSESPQSAAIAARPQASHSTVAAGSAFVPSSRVSGNLSVPAASNSAQRVAHALDGPTKRASSATPKLP